MKRTRKLTLKLTLNQTLALIAFVLGAVAVLGSPATGHVVRMDTRELATLVESEVDHVTAPELASWVLSGDTEYRLLDLRDPEEYAAYHIPTAENVALTGLEDYPLLRNERIVLYSGGGIHSAQAWFLLKAHEFPGVYMLLGGLEAWKDEVLFPSLPQEASPAEIAEFERVRFVSEHFGGTPRTGVAAELGAEEVALPKVEAPANVPPPSRKKKSKEGC